ncbi:hypothetical protein [Roseicyclus sp.]|uniref:hypothetical protein n=1 Tax=Roseicyclus sp. TaxID=1914329 RepID=UPI003F6B154C
MPDQTIFFLWLPLGGLVAVAIALAALLIAFSRLRRELAQRDHAAKKAAALGAAKPITVSQTPSLTREDIVAIMQSEMAAFQAALRADLVQMRADMRGYAGASGAAKPQDAGGRVDQAIDLARAGHDAAFIARTCDLDMADAAALVRFNGPGRVAARSPQH